jgi:hypothetical protein
LELFCYIFLSADDDERHDRSVVNESETFVPYWKCQIQRSVSRFHFESSVILGHQLFSPHHECQSKVFWDKYLGEWGKSVSWN